MAQQRAEEKEAALERLHADVWSKVIGRSTYAAAARQRLKCSVNT